MILQSLKMALGAIAASKMRSFLTMLGIIIGVIALVVLVSIVSSATTSITDEVNSLGNDMFTVSISDDKENPFRLSELYEMQDVEGIGLAAPTTQTNVTAKHAYNDTTATIYGTTAAYYEIQGLELQYGRFLKTTDVENSSYVAVLSNELANDLFDRTDVVGETVSLSGRNFRVVGVMVEDESMMAAFLGNSTVYVPYTVASRMSDMGSAVTAFYVSPEDKMDLDATDAALDDYMMERFRQDEDAFRVFNTSLISDAMSSITDILSLVLGGIAAISLLVGGIGIMNIMLVSVTERTREIGIRKAVGAGRGSILAQFLIEALVLSLVGCIIGVILSWGIIAIVSAVAGESVTFTISIGVVGVAVAFSLAIGVLFGIYPANKAAKKNPIEALRYDG